ncbi:MAG: hypothetical protein HFP76_07785 [Methylococcales symbiont of Iophon sp. n. MRB-2018]|nr:MAG: hypothetical protein HFP76_07785 [Methylococcales symbiont of Iophon sp. n. MRB-2018]
MRLPAKDGGNAVRLSGTIFAHAPVKTVSGFLLRTCRTGSEAALIPCSTNNSE